MDEAHTKGWPLVRHPVLHFPNDPVLLADRDEGARARVHAARGAHARPLFEFMLGADWLVVPVTRPGATSVRGYLPKGAWVPLWQCATAASGAGVVHGPGWHTLPAPLGEPPVYHRAGAPSAAGVRKSLLADGVLGPCA